MISYIDSYGTQIWFLLDSDVKNIEIKVRDYENDNLSEYKFKVHNKYNLNQIPFTIVLDELLPNTEYLASVFIDDQFVKELDVFTKRPHLDDVQFLLGSDLGYPSKKIFSHMEKTNSDFMAWLGGHVTLSSISFNSMLSDYSSLRSETTLNNLLMSTPQIATWGASDFALVENSSWDIKETVHSVFKLFWPNSEKKTYNYTFFDYGTYQRYSYNDLDLFLLDSRTFRKEDKSTLYGDKQIERLFQEIHNTGATFTVIASPSPFTFDSEDSFLNYKEQFDYFLYRLDMSDVNGLILISSGGKSGTEMNQYQLPTTSDKQKSIYEFNFSPLSMNNYSVVNISGKLSDRTLSFETYNENGNLIYRKNLHQNDLNLN